MSLIIQLLSGGRLGESPTSSLIIETVMSNLLIPDNQWGNPTTHRFYLFVTNDPRASLFVINGTGMRLLKILIYDWKAAFKIKASLKQSCSEMFTKRLKVQWS